MSREEKDKISKKQKLELLEQRPEVRHDPLLIQVVEELGEKANGDCAGLAIVKIPDDVKYYIDEYDGIESIHEEHRFWY